jgi:hypothetical protein
MQFHLGSLPRIARPALLFWDRDRPLVLVAQHKPEPALDDLLADLQESMALQWWQTILSGDAVHLHFYEAEPSPHHAHLKRVLAHSGEGDVAHRLGVHLTHHSQAAQCLHDLTQLAHQRFARMATAQATDWDDYNAKGAAANRRPEPWHCVLLTDLHPLAEHHGSALQNLRTLCIQGPRAGIVPLLLRKPEPDWLRQQSAPLFIRHLRAFWEEVLPQAWGLSWSRGDVQTVPQPLNQDAELWRLLTKFGLTLSAQAQPEQAQKLIDALVQGQEQSGERDFVNVRIGQSVETGKPVAFRMGEAANCYHAFVAGATRSGKSTLLNNLILGLCEAHGPDRLQLSLLDFKSNVGFGIYRGLAHVADLIDSQDPATVERALTRFADEIDRRGRLFAQQAKLVNANLDKYNALAEVEGFEGLPRWIMVIDEAQVLFENRTLKGLARYMLSRVSRMGAGLGLHLVICTQSFQNVDFDGDVKAQFRLRLGLKLANSQDCRALMGHDNDAPMHLRVKDGFPRQAVLNTDDGLPRGNQLMNLDFMSDEEIARRLAIVAINHKRPQRSCISVE